MKNIKYPKIYSLSTVGIRQHNHQDYLLHHIRTDFTGENGVGKSMIADLMQLIFVPKRDIWEPGTEGIDKSKRKIEGIPLNKPYVKFGYAFLNIETSKDKFITIGVYIPNTSRKPVRPFIVQGNEKFDKNKILKSFDQPILADDFYFDTGHIKDLTEISQYIFKEYNLFFIDFYRSENINLYFELLYKNQITPINLTKESSLKSFAKVIQSFSRAKTLDITNSKSLQKFLFEDSEEIKNRYNEESRRLEDLIKEYRKAEKDKIELQVKQKQLSELKKHYKQHKDTEKEFLKKELIYFHTEYENNKYLYEKNISELEKEQEKEKKLNIDIKIIEKEFYKTQIEIKSINENLIKLYGKLKPKYTKQRDYAKIIEEELIPVVEKLNKIKPLIEKYHSLKSIEEQYNLQKSFAEKRNLLDKLLNIQHFHLFDNSYWKKGTEIANGYYSKEIPKLRQEIVTLKELLEFFKENNKNSLFQWVINQKRKLTRNEELAITYYKDIYIRKPDKLNKGVRLIESPEKILSNIIVENDGIWVNFGNLKEYIPNNFITKQIFTDTEKLKKVIENEKEEIEKQIQDKEDELNNILNLQKELTKIGFNDKILEVYNNQEKIRSFVFDKDLTEINVETAKEVKEYLHKIKETEEKKNNASSKREKAIQELTTIDNQIKGISNDNAKIIQQIDDLKKQYTEPIEIQRKEKISDDYIEISNFIDELKTEKELLENDIIDLENRQKNISGRITANKNAISGLKAETPHLKKNYESSKEIYEKKEKFFKSNSEYNIDNVLLLKDEEITQKQIEELEKLKNEAKEKYEQEFIKVAQNFEETKDNKNEELEINKFNFHTLVNILCGKIGLEGISTQLEELNEKLISFGDLQMQIIIDVFTRVEKEYKQFKDTANKLNFFFKDPKNKISNDFHFEIDFNPKEDISIEWIEKMRTNARTHYYGRDLFSNLNKVDKEISPQELIVSIAKKFSKVKNCDLNDLLNPKYYFNLKVGLYDENKNEYSGSGGQAFTALALLGIGRLSIVENTQRKGIRFIIIEELSNIDDNNFNIFPQIAKKFGYQLITMTPKPFGAYNKEEWYLHMLIKSKDKDINTAPMSFFKTNTTSFPLIDNKN